MSKEVRDRVNLEVRQDTKDESFFIVIVKDNVGYRLAASYLTLKAAKYDMDFLLERLSIKGFIGKEE